MKMSIVLSACLLFSITAYHGFCGGSTAPVQAPAEANKTLSVLRVGVPDIPPNLDPGTGISNTNGRFLFNIFDMVMWDDASKNNEKSSYICEDYKVLDEFTTEIKIKRGITFQNGDPLTAEDVKFTIERIVFGDRKYFASTISSLFPSIEKVEVMDTYTVRIKTKTPDPVMLDRLSSPSGFYIVPKKYVEEIGNERFGQAPIGTGPYKVTSYSPEKVVLEYYKGYYGQRPVADKIEFLLYPEVSTRIVAMMTGEIDVCFALATEDEAQFKSAKGVRFEQRPYTTFHMLCYNSSVPPMNDVNLRKALNCSIDRELIVKTLWGGRATVPNGYNFKEFGNYYITNYPKYEYNVSKAKEYLVASKYKGEKIIYQLQSGYYPLGNEVAEAIVSMWQSIGVNAVVEINSTWTHNTYHVHNWNNGIRFQDPVGGMWLLWGPDSNAEKYYWKNEKAWAEFSELGQFLQTSGDFNKRYAANRRMMELFDGECVGTPLYQVPNLYALRDIFGWNHHSNTASFSFRAEHFFIK